MKWNHIGAKKLNKTAIILLLRGKIASKNHNLLQNRVTKFHSRSKFLLYI